MLFNSLDFAIFLPLVFVLYWFVTNRNLKAQNLLILLASYVFYGWWDWRFLFLLIFSTVLDYATGIQIANAGTKGGKKFRLWTSIIINLGFLGVFKYFNFFAGSLTDAFSVMGYKLNPPLLDIILPVGISFYTFHGLSYVLDIYYDRIKPEKDFVTYSVFVSFFPLLVAGPIERATHLLPQIKRERVFDQSKAIDGLKQILWGLFKKIVIADNCAQFANEIFNNSGQYGGSTLVLGALFFTFQIYGDFSGYSDIALGTARLFGIELLKNFSFPYFSRDIAEFWRRWHISLSSWFRDYLYIPLGGSKGSKWKQVRNTFIIFLVSGFWHGANWTFIVWGALNAIYFLPLLLTDKNRSNLGVVAEHRALPTVKELFNMLATFALVVFAWIFFRAENIQHAFSYIAGIFSTSLLSMPELPGMGRAAVTLFVVMLFMLIEWQGRRNNYAIEGMGLTWKRPVRWAAYYALVLSIYFYGNFSKTIEFIYFQF